VNQWRSHPSIIARPWQSRVWLVYCVEIERIGRLAGFEEIGIVKQNVLSAIRTASGHELGGGYKSRCGCQLHIVLFV
jgi:hypothetical protein